MFSSTHYIGMNYVSILADILFEKATNGCENKKLSALMISSVCFVFHLMLLHDKANCPSFLHASLSMTIHDVVIILRQMRWREVERREGFLLAEIKFEFLLETAEIRKEMCGLKKDVCVLKARRLELLTGVLRTKKKHFSSCVGNEMKFLLNSSLAFALSVKGIRNGCRLLPTHIFRTETIRVCYLDFRAVW